SLKELPWVHPVLTIRPPKSEPSLAWQVAPPESLTLDAEGQRVQFSVATQGDLNAPLEVRLQYDENALRVRDLSQSTWPSGSWQPVVSDGGSAANIAFDVASRLSPREAA